MNLNRTKAIIYKPKNNCMLYQITTKCEIYSNKRNETLNEEGLESPLRLTSTDGSAVARLINSNAPLKF